MEDATAAQERVKLITSETPDRDALAMAAAYAAARIEKRAHLVAMEISAAGDRKVMKKDAAELQERINFLTSQSDTPYMTETLSHWKLPVQKPSVRSCRRTLQSGRTI
jgi:hypothetical protein